MAKRNLGRVQGASIFHSNNTLTSDTTTLDYSDIVPTDIIPMVGDLVVANGATASLNTSEMLVFEVIDVAYSSTTFRINFLYKIESGSGGTVDVEYATDSDIVALFENEFSLATNNDINNLFN